MTSTYDRRVDDALESLRPVAETLLAHGWKPDGSMATVPSIRNYAQAVDCADRKPYPDPVVANREQVRLLADELIRTAEDGPPCEECGPECAVEAVALRMFRGLCTDECDTYVPQSPLAEVLLALDESSCIDCRKRAANRAQTEMKILHAELAATSAANPSLPSRDNENTAR